MRRNSRPTSTACALALALASPATGAADVPFSIEASDLLAHVVSAFTSRYPGVLPQNLDLATPVYFHCHTWAPVNGVSTIGGARFECTAIVNLDLAAVEVERIYESPDGNCVTGVPAKIAMVTVREAGSSRIHLVPDQERDGRVTDCDDELLGTIAAEHEDIPPENIVYDGGQSMTVSCESAPRANGLAPMDRDWGPCEASVVLDDETVMVEYRYVDDASCLIGKSSDAIVVKMDREGRTSVERKQGQGGGRGRGVECDDAFFNSPLPLLTSPR